MPSDKSTIIYTKTDEAPALATCSLLPIVQAFTRAVDVQVETRDISLAGRIVATFPDYLTAEQQQSDDLAELGQLAKTPAANIVKLPNISASIPQLTAAIRELQGKGYRLPDYPENPATDREQDVKARYDKVKGSAVNPVLREGNSDRRIPPSVKQYARKNPHSMGAWSSDSKTHVASMSEGDYYDNEQSTTVAATGNVRVEHIGSDGSVTMLKESVPVLAGDIIDATVMGKKALRGFLAKQIADAKEQGVLFSLHLKATMMKVSDPIIFGHAVTVFFAPVFEKYAELFSELGIDPNNGLGDVYAKIARLPEAEQDAIRLDIEACHDDRPQLAMVNSDKGITNLHVPSDVIVDASMPAAIRSSGQMWGPDGKLKDTKAVIPDHSYSGIYQETIDFCRQYGAFDPVTMGSVSNVGLMAQKAEEYGSHDKTFQIPAAGLVRVVDESGTSLFEHRVEEGDIWRMCQTRDAAVRDWVKLAVNRARATSVPAVFWLDRNRAHDIQLISKVERYLEDHDTRGLELPIMSPAEATRFSLHRIREGRDTISVTGNVLRDYLTDLFPIFELGTSAKMLSIVPLMNGGGLFETGSAGSAPKHIEQLLQENYLRWDSLGEFLALSASLEHLATVFDNSRAKILAGTLDQATGNLLDNNKSPARRLGSLDNRGSHFYIALYWAQALAAQTADSTLQTAFQPLADELTAKEHQILGELNRVQGNPVELGGYFRPDCQLASGVMRPSETLNSLIDSF